MQPDWHIVRDAGLWLLGIPKGGALVPVFEYCVQVQPQPGGISVNDIAQPLMLMGSMSDGWAISDEARMWPVKGASREKTIRAAIERAEGMVRAMRAQEAGITLATEMPRIRGTIQTKDLGPMVNGGKR